MLPPHALSPSCGAELASDAARCAACNATFGDGAAWKPLAAPPVPEPPSPAARVASGLTKVVLGLLSLGILGLGAAIAHSENGNAWSAVGVLAMVGVVFVAIQAKVRWSFVVLFGSMAFGLASCFANFRWHGG